MENHLLFNELSPYVLLRIAPKNPNSLALARAMSKPPTDATCSSRPELGIPPSPCASPHPKSIASFCCAFCDYEGKVRRRSTGKIACATKSTAHAKSRRDTCLPVGRRCESQRRPAEAGRCKVRCNCEGKEPAGRRRYERKRRPGEESVGQPQNLYFSG